MKTCGMHGLRGQASVAEQPAAPRAASWAMFQCLKWLLPHLLYLRTWEREAGREQVQLHFLTTNSKAAIIMLKGKHELKSSKPMNRAAQHSASSTAQRSLPLTRGGCDWARRCRTWSPPCPCSCCPPCRSCRRACRHCNHLQMAVGNMSRPGPATTSRHMYPLDFRGRAAPTQSVPSQCTASARPILSQPQAPHRMSLMAVYSRPRLASKVMPSHLLRGQTGAIRALHSALHS